MAARTALLRLSIESDNLPLRLAGVLKALSQKIDETLIHRYRPERHYMRGPGPRWHEKHSQELAATDRED